MNLNEVMRFVESEYVVINNTPCEICGGEYITESVGLSFDEGRAKNVSTCVCENCGNEREFLFRAPFVNFHDMENNIEKEELN
ncbi:MAG TPA: metal-binding protein [Clostridiaceae bacterium]|nr:metal-binding protein [Clostridiaceae bacterium]